MNEEQRISEPARRAAAQASRGSGVQDEARLVRRRSMTQMTSVRLEPGLVADLRRIADETNVSMSELLREAAVRLIADYRRQPLWVTIHAVGEPQTIDLRLGTSESATWPIRPEVAAETSYTGTDLTPSRPH